MNERSAMQHNLKTHEKPFWALRAGIKGFEFRKMDRDFRVGDTLCLSEVKIIDKEPVYTGEFELRRIDYIFAGGFGLPEGYCILSWAPLAINGKFHFTCPNCGCHWFNTINNIGERECGNVGCAWRGSVAEAVEAALAAGWEVFE